MNMRHADAPAGNAVFRLTVLQGGDRGKTIDLETNREYLVGRAEECDIRIDMSDKTVSRQHARLKIAGKGIAIINLSTTNPVLVKGKPVQKTTLNDKGQFRIGESLFGIEKTGGSAASGSGKRIPPLRIALAAALVLICIFIFIFLMTGGNPPAPTNTDMTKSSLEQTPVPVIPKTLPGIDMRDSGLPTTGLAISAEDMKKADQLFRQGMFFYDTGNLARAVDEWNQAVVLYPDHQDAQTWFLRGERELEEKIKTHYQNAMLYYKYMRYNDAAQEFRLVVELSRNKNSDQYINSLKLLNEIEGR